MKRETISFNNSNDHCFDWLVFTANLFLCGFGEKTSIGERNIFMSVKHTEKETILNLLADAVFGLETVIMLEDSKTLFRKVYVEQEDIIYLTSIWHVPILDAKGNEGIARRMEIGLSAENEMTFNWEKALSLRLPEAVDYYKLYE